MSNYNYADGDVQLSEHFMLHEFRSPDTDDVIVDNHLVQFLEQIYTDLGCTAITITSGYRSPDESVRVGGSRSDAHTYGMAADIVCTNADGAIDGKLVACEAQRIGIQGIGYMGNAVHVDTRGDGGYKNSHWFGDETCGNDDVGDFFGYFGIVDLPLCNQVDNTQETSDNVREEAIKIIRADYLRELGREPDQDGLNAYVNAYLNGSSEQDIINTLVNSPEWAKKFIGDCYRSYLGREASVEEINNWYGDGSARLRDICDAIYNSDEAIAHRG